MEAEDKANKRFRIEKEDSNGYPGTEAKEMLGGEIARILQGGMPTEKQ